MAPTTDGLGQLAIVTLVRVSVPGARTAHGRFQTVSARPAWTRAASRFERYVASLARLPRRHLASAHGTGSLDLRSAEARG